MNDKVIMTLVDEIAALETEQARIEKRIKEAKDALCELTFTSCPYHLGAVPTDPVVENEYLRGELVFLREQAQWVLDKLQDRQWWEDTRAFINQYPNEAAYDTLNRAEFAEMLNMLFAALHPDMPDFLSGQRTEYVVSSTPELEA
jgi:hypothetical protein